MFKTIEYAKILESEGVPRNQVEAHLKVISDFWDHKEERDRMEMLSKIDFEKFKKVDFENFKKECRAEFKLIHKRIDELEIKIDEIKREINETLISFEVEIKKDLEIMITKKLVAIFTLFFGASATVMGLMISAAALFIKSGL